MAGSKTGPLHRGEDGYYDQHRHWRPRTPLLPDDERVFPETVPSEYLATHPLHCGCSPCARYPSQSGLRRLKFRGSARRRG